MTQISYNKRKFNLKFMRKKSIKFKLILEQPPFSSPVLGKIYACKKQNSKKKQLQYMLIICNYTSCYSKGWAYFFT